VSAPTVLVVAAHALDEVLGCAGAMALHAAAGSAVHVLVLCGDGTGTDGRRRVAAGEAAALLGAHPPRFAGLPENRSDTVALSDAVSAVERAVNELRPGIVYVTHGGNLHVDHQTAYRAAATALRPVPGSSVSEFYAYEVASSTDWAPPGFGDAFQPTRFVEITPVLDRKMRALEFYAFDMRAVPHARSIVAVENLARARGATAGVPAAEAFAVLRTVVRSAG
jgi:LmbE family N-acetylglucosaminyl deacetylase